MTLGKKLQILRKQRGFSQEDLASKVIVSRQAVSKWESDETTPDIGNLVQLAKIFDVSLDFLLNDDIEEANKTPPILTAVKKETRKLHFIWLFATLIAVIIFYFIARYFHATTVYMIFVIELSVITFFVALIVFLVKHLKNEGKK